METQDLSSSNDLCPKGIVEQLLEIADKHDCISEIGNATAWRWREGIISRMPKKTTVCKVLREAFQSSDPQKWYQNTTGELKDYIKNAFPVDREIVDLKPDDVYEALFIITVSDGRGLTFDELVFKLAYLKFCKHEDVEPQYFKDFPDEKLLMELNGKWAESKASTIIQKFGLEVNEHGFYKLSAGYRNLASEEINQYNSDLIRYRIKATAGRSHFDMWRSLNSALSDAEMIEIEKKFIAFHNSILEEIMEISNRKHRDESTIKTRMFRVNCVSIPNQPEESIEWQS